MFNVCSSVLKAEQIEKEVLTKAYEKKCNGCRKLRL